MSRSNSNPDFSNGKEVQVKVKKIELKEGLNVDDFKPRNTIIRSSRYTPGTKLILFLPVYLERTVEGKFGEYKEHYFYGLFIEGKLSELAQIINSITSPEDVEELLEEHEAKVIFIPKSIIRQLLAEGEDFKIALQNLNSRIMALVTVSVEETKKGKRRRFAVTEAKLIEFPERIIPGEIYKDARELLENVSRILKPREESDVE